MSRKYLLFIVILLAVALFQTTTKQVTTPLEESVSNESYRVTSVIDGDTIKINRNGAEETIRLLGIDTPETDPTYNPVECYGKEATVETRTALLGKNITIETDSSQATRDKYNRLLAYVFLDGKNFNEHLIRGGFAREYTYAKPYTYRDTFKQAESEAKIAKRGLWSEEYCPR